LTQPIFEIIDRDKHYKIWENGKTEGFSDSAKITNRIPMVIARYVNRAIEFQDIENSNIPCEYKKRVQQLLNKRES
jgi:hypothetical protein